MLERIRPGDRTIPSKTFNAMADAIESMGLGNNIVSGSPASIMIQNTTGQDLNFGNAVGVSAPLFETPTTSAETEEQYRHFADRNYKAVKPTDDLQLAVTLEPIAVDEVGRVAVSGVVRAVVNVKDTKHTTVTFTANTVELESSDEGTLSFLIKPATTGKQWCDLVFGVSGGGESPFVTREMLLSVLVKGGTAYTSSGFLMEAPLMTEGRTIPAGTEVYAGRYKNAVFSTSSALSVPETKILVRPDYLDDMPILEGTANNGDHVLLTPTITEKNNGTQLQFGVDFSLPTGAKNKIAYRFYYGNNTTTNAALNMLSSNVDVGATISNNDWPCIIEAWFADDKDNKWLGSSVIRQATAGNPNFQPVTITPAPGEYPATQEITLKFANTQMTTERGHQIWYKVVSTGMSSSWRVYSSPFKLSTIAKTGNTAEIFTQVRFSGKSTPETSRGVFWYG